MKNTTRKKQSPTNVRSAKVLAISHARVLELFNYDADGGRLLWKTKAARKIVVGSVAGQQKSDGYWYASFDKMRLPLHHVIWFWHYGSWPTEYLGFKNGNYDDTHVENLKLLSASDKQRIDALAHFGLNAEQKAIKYSPHTKQWRVKYKGIKLGKFLTREAAKAVYDKAVAGTLDIEYQARINVKMGLLRLRAVWRMLLKSGATHTWTSFQHFVETVKDRPGKKPKLIAKDATLPLGPTNFNWEEISLIAAKARRDAENTAVRERERANWLARKFGVSVDWYNEQMEEQNGCCAICSKPETAVRNGKLLPLAVDHDHINGKPRGLLCSSCNIGIGSLQDAPELLRKAADYVERWRKNHTVTLPDNVIQLRKKDSA